MSPFGSVRIRPASQMSTSRVDQVGGTKTTYRSERVLTAKASDGFWSLTTIVEGAAVLGVANEQSSSLCRFVALFSGVKLVGLEGLAGVWMFFQTEAVCESRTWTRCQDLSIMAAAAASELQRW